MTAHSVPFDLWVSVCAQKCNGLPVPGMTWLPVQVASMQGIAEKYRVTTEENRRLYNEVQDLKGNIRVFCRVRPPGATGDGSACERTSFSPKIDHAPVCLRHKLFMREPYLCPLLGCHARVDDQNTNMHGESALHDLGLSRGASSPAPDRAACPATPTSHCWHPMQDAAERKLDLL